MYLDPGDPLLDEYPGGRNDYEQYHAGVYQNYWTDYWVSWDDYDFDLWAEDEDTPLICVNTMTTTDGDVLVGGTYFNYGYGCDSI